MTRYVDEVDELRARLRELEFTMEHRERESELQRLERSIEMRREMRAERRELMHFRRPGDDRPLQRPGVGRPPYI